MVSVTIKICCFCSCFVVFSNFDDLPSNLDWIIFHKFQKWDITNKISKNCRRKLFRLDKLANNKTWVLAWEFWLLGGWTTKIKVWSDIKIKNAKTLMNKIFWNFDVSDKKSADFSCLFTFFQKIVNYNSFYYILSIT